MTGLVSVEEARALVDRIRAGVLDVREAILTAWRSRAWVPLGYGSWAEMCEAEFDGVRLALPAEERREQIERLREAGMSTRAVGSALGVSQMTVQRTATESDVPVEITGVNGKHYRVERTGPSLAELHRRRAAYAPMEVLGSRGVKRLIEEGDAIADADFDQLNSHGFDIRQQTIDRLIALHDLTSRLLARLDPDHHRHLRSLP